MRSTVGASYRELQRRVTHVRRAYESVVDQIRDERIVEVVPELAGVRSLFVGRGDELSRLSRTVDGGPTVHLIDGMPGSGKTWLVNQAAQHAVDAEQPDFVAFVDLRGYDPVRPPADPGAVLGEFLRLLSVPQAQFAGLSTEERSRLYRDLPLALALVGSRARDRPDWTLADQVDRLVESAQLLRIEKGVEFALDLSYQALDEPARAMLRALSLHPSRRIDTGAAAALAELPISTAAEYLDALLAANLVSSGSEGRVEVHDLVRIFATGRALDEDPPLQRGEAAYRLATYGRAAGDT